MVCRALKRGSLDMPIWLIWALIALLVALVVLGIGSGKLTDILRSIGGLFTPA